MTANATTEGTWEQDVLKSELPVLVDFWAAWCRPCLAMAPVLDEVSNEYGDKIKVLKINVDENPQLAMQYRITSIPALKVFVNGEVDHEIVGSMPKPALEAQLANYIR